MNTYSLKLVVGQSGVISHDSGNINVANAELNI